MIYPNNFENKIEFSTVRFFIESYCISNLGKEKLNQIYFQTDNLKINEQITQTIEFVEIIKSDNFPALQIYDIREQIKRIKLNESYLVTDDFLKLYHSLNSIESIIRYLNQTKDSSKEHDYKYPHLHLLVENKIYFKDICKSILNIINEFGEVRDKASKELFRIRKEKSAAERSISKLIHNILKQAHEEGFVEGNVSPTIRDGRLVIPIPPAYKRKINGIIHDESDTGKTVYIEPTQVVEANNVISELENEERKEIIRILRNLTNEIRPSIPDILNSFDLLGDIDFIRAKAKFSIQTASIKPIIKTTPLLHWYNAIHPLLKIYIERRNADNGLVNQHVVPLDISLCNPMQRILIISGPNAGGKSVCLKTVGLLQYMFQCGFPVPVSENSQFGIFNDIFIDIGDEQSIENELSTFSSHLNNMKAMMKKSNGNSLLLIDEFGGGTEPLIGGALAQAMLKKLNMNGVFAVITTHYHNLKQFAQETDGIMNAAMLYDRGEMRPLFQLRIGTPGSSFAIEIARKTGIPNEVIQDASNIVGNDYISSDRYIQDIIRDKRYWENKRAEIHQKEKKMELLMNQYEEDINRLTQEKRQIIEEAKTEAKKILEGSNAIIERTIKDIKEVQAEKEQTKKLRNELNDFKAEIDKSTSDELDEYIRRKVNKIKMRRKRKEEKKAIKEKNISSQNSTHLVPENDVTKNLQRGDYVKLKGQQIIGKIMEIKGKKEANVAFGDVQMIVKLDKLIPSEPPTKEIKATTFVSRETQENIRETKLNFKSDIDIRGMRADEAIQTITYFIDDALVASVHRLRILHGTGTGVLKTVIRNYLSSIPAVSTLKDEHPDFGGAGITIVELK